MTEYYKNKAAHRQKEIVEEIEHLISAEAEKGVDLTADKAIGILLIDRLDWLYDVLKNLAY